MKCKIPPPIICLVCMAIMYAIPPVIRFPSPPWLAGILLALSVTLGIASLISFKLANTTINPVYPEQTSYIVTTGVYRFSRNPMYLSIAIFLAAWAVYLENVTALVVLPLFIFCLNYLQIIPEEQALEHKFGEAYLAYKKGVRRWL